MTSGDWRSAVSSCDLVAPAGGRRRLAGGAPGGAFGRRRHIDGNDETVPGDLEAEGVLAAGAGRRHVEGGGEGVIAVLARSARVRAPARVVERLAADHAQLEPRVVKHLIVLLVRRAERAPPAHEIDEREADVDRLSVAIPEDGLTLAGRDFIPAADLPGVHH